MKPRMPHCLSTALAVGLLSAAASIGTANAQVVTNITPDGTLGTTVTPLGGGGYAISGGTVKGGNQFNSFDRFNVGTGDAALFDVPSGVQNILNRVTGKLTGLAPSQIDGYIGTLQPVNVNVFLMNPAGIMFGPNSQIDINGAFYATTANRIDFADGTHFNAIPSTEADNLLSSAAPSAFGFLDSNPAAIDVNTTNYPFLVGATGRTLSFVGGPINVGAADGSAPAYMLAPAGRLNLISVASAGEATFDGTGFNVDGFSQLGNVAIQGGSIVDAKDVYIRGGQLTIDNAVVLPGASQLFGLGPPPDGGEVNVDVRGAVTITGTGPEPFTQAPPGILTYNGVFDPSIGNFVYDPTVSTKVPDVTIKAGSLSLSGYASIQTDRYGLGDPPNVTIDANSLTVQDGAGIGLFNFLEGPGGTLSATAPQITLAGGGVAGGAVGVTGLLAQGLLHPAYATSSIDPTLTLADSGTIVVNAAQSLTMSGGAQITTDSRTFGQSGDITINAGDVNLTDRGGIIAAQSLFAGNSGNVTVSATGQININNGFVIAATTFGSGESGNVNISAGEGVTISGTASGIASQTAPPPQADLDAFASLYLGPGATFNDLVLALGLDPATATIFDVLAGLANFVPLPPLKMTPGNGGTITVSAPSVSVSGQNSAIDSGTAWNGDAGAVQVNAGTVNVSGGGQIRSRSGIVNIETGDLELGTGNAGTVTVDASNSLTVSGANSSISTSTYGNGNGGNVVLSAGNQVSVLDGGQISADSGGTIAGGVHSGTGLAGDISVTAGNEIYLENGGITTQALTADGGNITLSAKNKVQLQNGVVSTSVQGGAGKGGNITIDPQFVILNTSQIIANAYGGPGGNINIVANNYLPSWDSVVSASSRLSTQGTVQIQSPENDVAGGIAQLPAAFLDAANRLRGRCSAERTGAKGSFAVAGRGGVTVNPDGYLPSSGFGAGPERTAGRIVSVVALNDAVWPQPVPAFPSMGCSQ